LPGQVYSVTRVNNHSGNCPGKCIIARSKARYLPGHNSCPGSYDICAVAEVARAKPDLEVAGAHCLEHPPFTSAAQNQARRCPRRPCHKMPGQLSILTLKTARRPFLFILSSRALDLTMPEHVEFEKSRRIGLTLSRS
jgi:hypothetical protein